jgi:hypothetical protein
MPVIVASMQNRTGLLFICSGRVTAKDLLDAKDQLLETPSRLQECRFATVDLELASSLELSTDDKVRPHPV